MVIPLRGFKPRPEVLHRFGIVDTDQQSQITQPTFENRAVFAEQIIGDRDPRRSGIDTEPVSFAQNAQKLGKRQRAVSTRFASPQHVKVDEMIEDCICKDDRSNIARLPPRPDDCANDPAF